MLRKWNRILSIILAIALIATTFHSDLATIRVFAEEDITEEAHEEEPAVEESAEPEYVEPEEDPEPASLEEEGSTPAPEGEGIQEGEPGEGENPEGEGEPTEEELEEKELTEEELAELAEKEAKEKAEKEAAEKEAKKKLVTVSYSAELGGHVSNSSETIDINDEEAKFEGSTATANNKYYQFVAWVDADGNTVCSDSTFIPSDIEEDTSFKATFMKLSEMPAQSFDGSAGGMNVSVSADEGIFPEGTTMHVSAISDDEALDAAIDALGESVQQAKGVDITFRNADGEEIEPADSRYVHVSISLASELEGESFSVVHKDDSGNADVIAGASADGAEFEANQFSIYIVAGSGDSSGDQENLKAVETYIFYNGTEVFRKEMLKQGEELENPGIPDLQPHQEFKGWFYKENNQPVQWGIRESVTAEKTIECYAKIQTTFYLTFIGVDGEVVYVRDTTVVGDEEAWISTEGIKVDPKLADQAHRGWSTTEGGKDCVAEVNARKDDTVYAVVMDAYWITFNENDGNDHGGASYTGPVAVFEDQLPSDVKPADPTRNGYTFDGWYTQASGEDGGVIGDPFPWGEKLNSDITLYAKWTPNLTTKYTINIWQQKVSDSKNITSNSAKSYDFKESYTVTGRTGAELNEDSIADYKNKGDEGFHYSWFDIVRVKDGDTVPEGTIRAKGDTIINVYYDRDVMNIIFKTYTNGGWNNYKEFVGLYGQDIGFYPEYSWPAEYDWYSSHTDGWGQHYGSGTRLTFLDAFLFKGLSGLSNGGKTLTQYAASPEGTNVVNFITQDLDDSWPTTWQDQMHIKGSSFTVTDKYTGFTAYSYKGKNGDNWKTLGPRQSNDTYGTRDLEGGELNIRFARNKYDIILKSSFLGNVEEVGSVKDIPYGAAIADYKDDVEDLENKPGYTFKGWFEDSTGGTPFTWTGTMPAANKVIYGCYEIETYHVSLNADGGTFYGTQIGEFDVEYGTTLDRVSLEKTYKDGYQLVGWYEGDKPYDYRGIDANITLKAKWRNPGSVKVEYDAEPYGSNAPVDNYNYATNSTVVVGAPPTVQSGYTFLGWTIVGDEDHVVYSPNGFFEIQNDYIINGKVTLKANYIRTGGENGPNTYITYHANDGTGRTKMVSTGAGTDPLLVNEKIIALTAADAGFDRGEAYEFLGWSKSPEGTTVDIPAGATIAADNNGIPEANNLYAVWELKYVDYVIEYYKGSQRIFVTDPMQATVGTSITLDQTQLNAHKPQVGYQDGIQEEVPYEIKKDQDNIIKVIYNPIRITVTVKGTHVTKTYDGTTYEATGFEVVDITEGSGYKAEYVGYRGDSDVSATHVYESDEKDLKTALFYNKSDFFDDSAITFVLGDVKSNKVTINPAKLTIVTDPATKTYDGTPLTAPGRMTGLVNGETASFKVTGSVTYPSEGKKDNTYTLDWDGTADERDYEVSATVGKLEVIENTTATITVTTVGGTYVYDGQTYGATVTVTGVPAGYTVETAASSATATNVADGKVTATADQLKIVNGNGDDVTGKLTIDKKDGTIQITPAPITIKTEPGSKVYDGTPLTAEGSFEGLVNGETATFTVTGSQTEVGTSDNTYTLVWDGTAKESNYELVSETIGKLTVSHYAKEIVVTTTGGKFTYDGTPKGATVEVSTLPTGYTLAKAASTATATDVTTSPVAATADQLVIKNAAGQDVTDKLTITYVNDTIEVTPATLTIVTESANKPYDGDPLTADGNYSGLVNNETITFNVTGSITNVGKADNTYELIWNGTAKESNYVIDKTVGELEVTEYAGTVLVITTGGEFVYDGTAKGATVEVQNLPKGYTVSKAASNATATDVTTEDVPATYDELVILNALGQDITSALTIDKQDGFIKITPAEVTVNIKGDQKTYKYSGYEQKAEGYEVTGITDATGLYTKNDFTFSGEAIAKGTFPDKYDMKLSEDQFENTNTNFEVKFEIEDGYVIIEDLGPGEKFRITAITTDTERDYTGEYYDGFDYDLIGEGPTQGIVQEAIDRAVNFFRSAIGGITAGAEDGEGEKTVDINGITYTVRGLYVPTRERDADTYPLPIEGEMKVYQGDVDVTPQFELVEKREGELTIHPMVITVTSGSSQKVYDARPLTNNTITTDKDWGKGDSVRYVFTGSQTLVGESDNLFTVEAADETTDLEKNYRIIPVYGRLRVTNAPTPPGGGGTTITDDPTPTAPTPIPPAPAAAVLGEQRPVDGAAVLGARRGRTEDAANQTGRFMAILIAAAVATALLLTKKKEEEDQQ